MADFRLWHMTGARTFRGFVCATAAFVLGNPVAAMIPAVLMFGLLFIGGEEIIEFLKL